MRFFNTTLGISMLADGQIAIETLNENQVTKWFEINFENVANPSHSNSLQAITQKIGVDVRNAKGGRISLESGDECLVAQIGGIPRETREFTDEEIEAATFTFRLVRVMNEKGMALNCIKRGQKSRKIGNEQANLATVALNLEGDEALLANRLICRGSDPASLELLLTGVVSEPTMRAHTEGPGSLKAEEKEGWLVLASASIDENAKEDTSVLEKAQQFFDAIQWLKTATQEERGCAVKTEYDKIINLPYEESEIGGITMRVYTSDRGFASAYWSGVEFAAVKTGGPTFVGSCNRPLSEIGVAVHKELSPQFGLIFG